MSNKRWSIILAIFFLVQVTVPAQVFSLESNSLNPPTKVDINYPDKPFEDVYDAVSFGMLLYKLDAIKGFSKDIIIKDHGSVFLNSDVKFDLKNIGFLRKGCTRYYPFSVGGKNFIMRIFLTTEKTYQLPMTFLWEDSLPDPAVTFQILPPLSEMLKDHKITPQRTYPAHEVDSSS